MIYLLQFLFDPRTNTHSKDMFHFFILYTVSNVQLSLKYI